MAHADGGETVRQFDLSDVALSRWRDFDAAMA
jgi:hypothetical protein